jgi:hypothetical protein
VNIDEADLRALFDIATGSMDFGSGFLDSEEVVLLRRIAEMLGVDPMEGTPINFKASFAHEYVASARQTYAWPDESDRFFPCQVCTKRPELDAHHGISTPEVRW